MVKSITLQAFIANLDFAVRSNEPVLIAGGEFAPDELEFISSLLKEKQMKESE